jgi:DNA end-binding protein Ku
VVPTRRRRTARRPGAGEAAEVKLAKQVISTFDGPLNLADYTDAYREGLQRIIDAKIAGEQIVAPPQPEVPPRVVNLMAALKQSLDAVKKTPARVTPPKVAIAADRKRKRA